MALTAIIQMLKTKLDMSRSRTGTTYVYSSYELEASEWMKGQLSAVTLGTLVLTAPFPFPVPENASVCA